MKAWLMKNGLEIYSDWWPAGLFAYWGALFVWVRFYGLSGWTAVSLTALGLVWALWLLATVDLAVAFGHARKGEQYAPLPGRFKFLERLEPLYWLIVPVGFLIGLYVGNEYW